MVILVVPCKVLTVFSKVYSVLGLVGTVKVAWTRFCVRVLNTTGPENLWNIPVVMDPFPTISEVYKKLGMVYVRVPGPRPSMVFTRLVIIHPIYYLPLHLSE